MERVCAVEMPVGELLGDGEGEGKGETVGDGDGSAVEEGVGDGATVVELSVAADVVGACRLNA